jgi:hypothetical protein
MAQGASGLTITRLGLAPVKDLQTGIDKNELQFTNSMLSNVVFSNVITPTFSEQMVYGKNEPLVVYKNTTRTINFSFTMASTSQATNYINSFQSMVYPLYDKNNVVIGTPIFKIRYNNLIYDPYNEDGLIGIIKDLNVGEQFNYGRVLMGDVGVGNTGVISTEPFSNTRMNDGLSILTYTSMKVAFNFIPLPSKPIGYNANGFSIADNQYPFKKLKVS